MQSLKEKTSTLDIEQLNDDIKQFTQVHPITSDMKTTHKGVSRLVMLDRYAFKDTEKKTLKAGDFVVLTIKEDRNSLHEEPASLLKSIKLTTRLPYRLRVNFYMCLKKKRSEKVVKLFAH